MIESPSKFLSPRHIAYSESVNLEILMKKFFRIGMTLAFCIAVLGAAKSQSEISNADKAMLFGAENANVNIVLLSGDEMVETKGEGWFAYLGTCLRI